MADDQDMERRSPPADDAASRSEDGGVFSPVLRPVFLGNLTGQFQAAEVRDIFERPHQPDSPEAPFDPISVERVDLKRGYCFVFLHDATSEEHKKRIQTFVDVINGM
jgi:arginine/serine-rich splicing factor 4/5/6